MITKFNEYFNYDSNKLTPEELELLNLPLEQRQEITKLLKGSLNESISSSISNFIGKKMMSWLINRNERDIKRTIETLTIFDPEDFSNLKKPEIIYLAGGMDMTTDGGVDWRRKIEKTFGMKHVVNTEDIFKLGYTGKLNTKKYPKPILLDPTMKELIRKEPEFIGAWKKLKAQEIQPDELKYMGNVINKEITNPDLRIINKCDTIFAKLDGSQGPGTLGELQIATLLRLNVFTWLTGNYPLSKLNLWIMPEIHKIVRTDEEVMRLIKKIKNINS